jgi:hypothetical protein
MKSLKYISLAIAAIGLLSLIGAIWFEAPHQYGAAAFAGIMSFALYARYRREKDGEGIS